jgi:hypothetical protein
LGTEHVVPPPVMGNSGPNNPEAVVDVSHQPASDI